MRLALLRLASERLAPERLAPERSASMRLARVLVVPVVVPNFQPTYFITYQKCSDVLHMWIGFRGPSKPLTQKSPHLLKMRGF